ncbi:MAG: hypothetical protein V4722_02270 [Bacteroidota bacterium]
MKTIIEAKGKKQIAVRIDKSLDKYNGVSLFPKKVAKAKAMLATIGLPDKEKLTEK